MEAWNSDVKSRRQGRRYSAHRTRHPILTRTAREAVTEDSKTELRAKAAVIRDEMIGVARALADRDCGAFQSEMREAQIEYLAKVLAAAPVNASMGEDPVAYQQRERRRDDEWSHWYPSNKECYDEFQSGIRFGRMEYEVRALYTTPRPASELVAALRAIAWMPSAIDDRDGLEAFNEARRIARAALTQTSGVAASLPTAGVGVCEHDWQKNTNDLVMWVCSKCRLARPGEQPGFTKPQNTTPKAASVTDDMVDVAIRAYFGDEHRWHIGMSTEIQDEVRSGMRRALCSALTPIEGV